MNNSVSYLTLFKTFLKIGIVTFGGGYAMIPIIESEVVDKHHWMTKEECHCYYPGLSGRLGHQHEFPARI